MAIFLFDSFGLFPSFSSNFGFYLFSPYEHFIKMCATLCNNVKPIDLEIKQRKSRDKTKKDADHDFKKIVLAFGTV